MGNPTSSSSSKSLVLFSLLVIFSLVKDGDAAADRKLMAVNDFDIIKLSSILPDSVCDSSLQGTQLLSSSTLKVVHKHGPCHKSTHHKTKESSPSATQILTHDDSRVNSIHSRVASNSAGNTFVSSESATLPAKSGSSLGAANYIVTVGLGTPKKDLSLIFDTGSVLTWTQCQPCVETCYDQQDPIFDSYLSTGYSNITCNTEPCNQLKSATGNNPRCSPGNVCIYEIQYGDQTFSFGYFAKDNLTLSPTEVIPEFYFGCGQNNQGLFGHTAGIIGLARAQLSIVSQTKAKYGEVFSYCLPSKNSGTGYLTFGKSVVSNAVQFVPFSSSKAGTSFYFIDLMGIYVGGHKLPISSTVFSAGGSIIDSGTVITRLPPAAYTPLRDTFRKLMSMYPLGNPVSILDTCYDFTKYKTVKIPNIRLGIGGKKIDIDGGSGVLYVVSSSQVCLAFAPNGDASDTTILGNVQQRTMQVVYDVGAGKIGFGRKGCA